MKLKQILLFTLCITIFACSTDSSNNEDEDEKEITDNTLVKKIMYNYDNESYTETFTYDGNKLLSIDAGDGYKSNYTYSDDLLVRVDSYEGEIQDAYTIITYDNNDKISSYILHIVGDNTFRYEFEESTNNTINVKTFIGDLNSQTTPHINYIISYEGLNILKETEIGYDYELSYQYDIKNGAFKNVTAIEIINLVSYDFGGLEFGNTNNIIKNTENDSGSITTETFEYTYNDNDYPKTAVYKRKYEDDSEDAGTVEYFYE